jgi:hypothetical protein
MQALDAQRAAITQAFSEEKLRCAQRFAITACELDLAQRQRDALAPLRQQELALKQADHQRRGEAQLARLANKVTDANSPGQQRERVHKQNQHQQRQERAQDKARPQRTPAEVLVATRATQERLNKQQEKARAREETAAASAPKRASHEARLLEAQEHKAQKLRELEAGRAKAAKPLPTPP